jgi:hypothetical protein
MSTSKDHCSPVSLLRVRTQIRSDSVGHRVITPLILEPVIVYDDFVNHQYMPNCFASAARYLFIEVHMQLF